MQEKENKMSIEDRNKYIEEIFKLSKNKKCSIKKEKLTKSKLLNLSDKALILAYDIARISVKYYNKEGEI